MGDRQLLLAKQSYAGTKAMLRRVGILAVDEAHPFTVVAVGEALAHIHSIVQFDDVTAVSYRILPEGEQGYCTPGNNLRFNVMVFNNGMIRGGVFCRILGDGALIWDGGTQVVDAGYFATFRSPVLTMPAHDFDIIIEAGH